MNQQCVIHNKSFNTCFSKKLLTLEDLVAVLTDGVYFLVVNITSVLVQVHLKWLTKCTGLN